VLSKAPELKAYIYSLFKTVSEPQVLSDSTARGREKAKRTISSQATFEDEQQNCQAKDEDYETVSKCILTFSS
jgi:hypothetical protein